MAISPASSPRSEPEPIRPADPSEWEMLRQLEVEADRLFEQVGIGPFDMTEEDDHFAKAAVVLVAGRPPKGFACVELVDGLAHLWQLSVHPSAGRQGIGRSLVEAVCEWASSNGYPAVTLTTYRDVPWNAPFYSQLGFQVLEELSPGLNAIRDHEKEIGDDDFSPRVAMRKDLGLTRMARWRVDPDTPPPPTSPRQRGSRYPTSSPPTWTSCSAG